MLRAKALPPILQQATSNGVKSSIIVTTTGELLASAGTDTNEKLVGAIAMNVWTTYHKTSEDVNCLLIECEEGRLGIRKVGDFLVCVYGDSTVQFGILKAKVDSLNQYLDEPLQQLSSIN
ncbi:hypothetical protein PROFUN_06083 [Planoprotostelium fungivorum]|uniref:Roadblock/LAMTOR2 domain-containing protein n=1 Tax=Planoprotostelium fungivorum TaxID=1890364 RepID=A0A2P6NPS1_9EUKA|nr:hypothetical protein PROFUN_06083 [Planoprotostelium fungivorum]